LGPKDDRVPRRSWQNLGRDSIKTSSRNGGISQRNLRVDLFQAKRFQWSHKLKKDGRKFSKVGKLYWSTQDSKAASANIKRKVLEMDDNSQ